MPGNTAACAAEKFAIWHNRSGAAAPVRQVPFREPHNRAALRSPGGKARYSRTDLIADDCIAETASD
jgi:hypothetical protein